MQTTERFEKVSVDRLIPYARNARTHSKEQILQLRSSLREFGFVNPVIVDHDLNIIAGHGRVLAAKAEDMDAVPCVFVEHLTDAQKKAYILADNRLALSAGWDEELLALEFGELQDLGFDLNLTGFDPKEIEKLFNAADKVEDDDFDLTAALEEAAFVLPGDLWTVGRHRLLCGDATKPEDVARLMGGKKANLLLTDPPYGVSYESGAGKIAGDDFRGEELLSQLLLPAFRNAAAALDDEASAYIFHADTQGEWFRRAFREAGFRLSGVCQWVKPSLVLGRSPYQWQNEPCLFGWKVTGRHKWYGDRKQTTVWEYAKPKKNDIHPTMKPLDLLAKPIENSSTANGIVLDLFAGSFSTGIACEQLNRICFAMELDPKYASASLRRFAEYVGSGADVFCERGGEKFQYSELVKEVRIP
ncbi:MAG: site-specific DNA-methyltransferase [Oscillospiraceae bacterium]|jgi:DNA modification methylase|nr:site-specific DNA-methyltransferase [Oscillospiraceae bacterium]